MNTQSKGNCKKAKEAPTGSTGKKGECPEQHSKQNEGKRERRTRRGGRNITEAIPRKIRKGDRRDWTRTFSMQKAKAWRGWTDEGD